MKRWWQWVWIIFWRTLALTATGELGHLGKWQGWKNFLFRIWNKRESFQAGSQGYQETTEGPGNCRTITGPSLILQARRQNFWDEHPSINSQETRNSSRNSQKQEVEQKIKLQIYFLVKLGNQLQNIYFVRERGFSPYAFHAFWCLTHINVLLVFAKN